MGMNFKEWLNEADINGDIFFRNSSSNKEQRKKQAIKKS